MRVLCYECVCAGGLGSDPPASLRAEGWAMLAALAEDLARVPGASVSVLLEESFPPVDGVACLRTDAAHEASQFREAVAAHDAVIVIAPESGDILARRSEVVLAERRRLLGCSPAAVRLTGDKLALWRHWSQRGVPTPATLAVDNALPPFFPCVLKLRIGAGSQAMRLVTEPERWPAALESAKQEAPGEAFIVQPYHPGRACSVGLLVGAREVTSLQAGEQILSQDGCFHYLGGRLPLSAAEAARVTRRALQAIEGVEGLAGYIGVDVVLGLAGDGTEDVVIEINPRLTTSYIGLRRLTTCNLAELTVRILLDESHSPVVWDTGSIIFDA